MQMIWSAEVASEPRVNRALFPRNGQTSEPLAAKVLHPHSEFAKHFNHSIQLAFCAVQK